MKWKVCGNRENVEEVAGLEPDYMGFIYWEPSSRALPAQGVDLSAVPQQIKRVGVFVDENAETIAKLARRDQLDFVQLHGNEQPSDVQKIKTWLTFPLSRPLPLLSISILEYWTSTTSG